MTSAGSINVTTQHHLSGLSHATAHAIDSSAGNTLWITISDVGTNGTAAAIAEIRKGQQIGKL